MFLPAWKVTGLWKKLSQEQIYDQKMCQNIFVSKVNQDNSFSKPINLGSPINTAYDDFAYVVNLETQVGYFSSNRPEGKGSDDIYKFIENATIYSKEEQFFTGKLEDALFGTPIANAIVSLFDDSKKMVDKTTTNANGEVIFNNNYKAAGWYLKFEHSAYETKEEYIKSQLISNKNTSVALLPKEIQLKHGVDLAKFFSIQNIYFDLFVGIQHKGLIVSHANMTERTWYRYIEPFIAELRVSNKSDLLEFEKLHKAYASVILPQLNIAISHGFIANWLYKIER